MTRVKKTEHTEDKVKKETRRKVSKTSGSAQKTAAKKAVKSERMGLTVDVYDVDGKMSGKISLPEEIFGGKASKQLLAQAVRVYLANQRQGTVSTKTRGEVDGSTRKIYRQKGTGRARHGSIRAPIFVHGGIVFGPKPRDFGLDLPKKMKKKALFGALTAKLAEGGIKIISGIAAVEPKTKQFMGIITKLGLDEKKKILLVTDSEQENVKRGARNIEGVTITAVERINTYEVLYNNHLLFMKEAIDEMKKHFLKN